VHHLKEIQLEDIFSTHNDLVSIPWLPVEALFIPTIAFICRIPQPINLYVRTIPCILPSNPLVIQRIPLQYGIFFQQNFIIEYL